MNSALVPITEISTDQVLPDQRVDYWESYAASALVGLRCSDLSEQGLRMGARCYDLGTLHIADMRGNEHAVERTRPLARAYPRNVLFACMLLEGDGFFFQSGECIRMTAGDILLFFSDFPYLYGWSRAGRQLVVEVDFARLQPDRVVPRSPVKLDARLRAERLAGGALYGNIARFMERPLAEEAPHLAARAQCLIESLLAPAGSDPNPSDTTMWQLTRAELFISEHLSDPDLTPETIAGTLKMSVRHLNRLFATRQQTVSQWIWDRRLASARDELGSDRGRPLRVADIAVHCGFVNQAHFARRFKDRYGLTPTEYRRQTVRRSEN